MPSPQQLQLPAPQVTPQLELSTAPQLQLCTAPQVQLPAPQLQLPTPQLQLQAPPLQPPEAISNEVQETDAKQRLQAPQATEVATAAKPLGHSSMEALTAKIQAQIQQVGTTGSEGEEPKKEPKKKKGRVSKKPAACQGPKKSVKILKKPSAAQVQGKPPLPAIGSPVTHYLGGKIYVSKNRSCFRIILDAKDYATEVNERWGASKPTPASWAAALRRVEQGA